MLFFFYLGPHFFLIFFNHFLNVLILFNLTFKLKFFYHPLIYLFFRFQPSFSLLLFCLILNFFYVIFLSISCFNTSFFIDSGHEFKKLIGADIFLAYFFFQHCRLTLFFFLIYIYIYIYIYINKWL